jgi:hypothetical protein
MAHNHTWEADGRSGSQEILRLFIEPEVSCPQEPATGPYAEPDESSRYRNTLFV